MTEFSFVYFDLDDTLLDHHHAERAALADVATEFASLRTIDLRTIRATYHALNRSLWQEYGEGRIDRHTLQSKRFSGLLEKIGANNLDPLQVGSTYMQRYADHWRTIPGAADIVRRVADRVPVGLITNGFAEVQRRKLDAFPEITHPMQAVIISEEVGYMKPHPALFDAARQASKTDGPILYVGDSFQSDVRGALRAGWSVVWYRPEYAADEPADSNALSALVSRHTAQAHAHIVRTLAELENLILPRTADQNKKGLRAYGSQPKP